MNLKRLFAQKSWLGGAIATGVVVLSVIVFWAVKQDQGTSEVIQGDYEAAPIETLPPEKPLRPEACEAFRANEEASEILNRWNELMQSSEDKTATLNQMVKKGPGVFFQLSAKKGAVSFAQNSACGELYSSLAQDLSEGGDEVLEIDKNGRTLTKWKIPFESEVVGIMGSDILVKINFHEYCTACYASGTCAGRSALLKVSSKGVLNFLPSAEKSAQLTFQDCPQGVESKSELNLCLTLADEVNKAERWLVVQGPCT